MKEAPTAISREADGVIDRQALALADLGINQSPLEAIGGISDGFLWRL
jgi:hypothetical protein